MKKEKKLSFKVSDVEEGEGKEVDVELVKEGE